MSTMSVCRGARPPVAMVICSLSSVFTTAPPYAGRYYHSRPWACCQVVYGVLVVFGQTKGPPPLVDYLPDRHYLPLLPCTVACIVQADTYRTALHSIVCISALNRSTLTGSSLPCYPLPGPSPPDLDRSLPVKSGCPQSPSASDPPPG